jgi:hypothetical protein
MSSFNMTRRALGLGLGMILCMAAVAPAQAAQPPQVTEDGLELTKVKGVDLLYRRPGATLGGYTKITVDPVEVAFSKSWDPRDYGTYGLKASEVEKIRTELGKLARDTFVKKLQEGGYPEASAADEGVLRVTAYIVDLYVNAPDTMQAGRSRTYVANAGHMTLVLELRDAVTGTLLVRGFDRATGTDNGRFQWSNSVINRAEAERALGSWAKRLKDALDAAKQPG